MPIIKPLISLAVAGVLAGGALLRAEGNNPIAPGPLAGVEQTVVGTLEEGFKFLSLALDAVLPYTLPRVQPNGDIIIKYVPPKALPPVEETPAPIAETIKT